MSKEASIHGSHCRLGITGYVALGTLIVALSGCASGPLAPPRAEPPTPAPDFGPTAAQERVRESDRIQPDINRFETPADIELPTAADGALALSRENAVFLALRNNRTLGIQQLTPVVRGAFEQIEKARYDVNLFAQAAYSEEKSQFFFPGIGTIPTNLGELVNAGGTLSEPNFRFPILGRPTLPEIDPGNLEGEPAELTTEIRQGQVGFNKAFVTGTRVEVTGSNDRIEIANEGIEGAFFDGFETDAGDIQNRLRTGITLTQALLRGGSPQANLARIRQAELETMASSYQLRGFAESMVAQVETLYWDYYLTQRQVNILEDSVTISETQLRELEERVEVGQVSRSQLPAARAELAVRRQALIDARSASAQLRLRLLQQLNPPGANDWEQTLELTDVPSLPPALDSSVEEHVALAMQARPDLNEARLLYQSGELQVLQTRNGLLPQLNLFITLGKSGYADSFGDASDSFVDDSFYDASAALRFDYPWGNRQGRALYQQALAGRDQRELSLQNLEQLAAIDVRTAYQEVLRAQQQVSASAATRRLQEEALRSETESFRVGRATQSDVNRAQRDLVSSQIDEVRAIADLRKALVTLYRQDGTLLVRRGVEAPGSEPTVPIRNAAAGSS